MVPISAHALFARPMVVAPTSVLAVEVLAQTEGAGVLWCDGRRTVDLPPGRAHRGTPRSHAGPAGPPARGAVHRPARGQVRPARRGLARCRSSDAGAPATGDADDRGDPDQLARGDRRVGARARRRADRDHRRDRRRQDHAGDRARAAAGRPRRHRRRAHRRPGGPRRGRGRAPTRSSAAIADEHGGEVEAGLLLLGRQVSAEGRSRAFLGGASVPASALARVGEALVAVHGQSDQHRLLRPEAQRDALDAFAGRRAGRGARPLPRRVRPAARRRGGAARGARLRTRARPRGRRAAARASRRSRRSTRSRGEEDVAGHRGVPARVRRHPAHGRRDGARGAVLRPGRARRAGRRGRGAPGAGERARARPRGRRRWPTGSPR